MKFSRFFLPLLFLLHPPQITLGGAYKVAGSIRGSSLSVGPLSYFMYRSVPESGAHQAGTLFGMETHFERRGQRGLYLGGGALFAEGGVLGKTASGRDSRSSVRDYGLEMRLGHTFCTKGVPSSELTPFAAIGYFCDINKAKPPTWVLVRNKFHFHYVGLGLLARCLVRSQFSLGLKLQCDAIFDGKDRQSYVDSRGLYVIRRLKMGTKPQFSVALPLSYCFESKGRRSTLECSPFYNFRYYGKHMSPQGYFRANRFHILGLKLSYIFRF